MPGGARREPAGAARSGAALGVHEQVPLQPSLKRRRLSRGQVRDEGQLVEDATTEVVGNNGEAIIGTLELPDTKQQYQLKPPGLSPSPPY